MWTINLNKTHKSIIKFLGDNLGENLDNLGWCDDFLDITPKA